MDSFVSSPAPTLLVAAGETAGNKAALAQFTGVGSYGAPPDDPFDMKQLIGWSIYVEKISQRTSMYYRAC